MLDSRTAGHAREQGARTRLPEPALGPADEGGVDVVRRNGAGHGVEMSLARTTPLRKSAELQPRLDEQGLRKFQSARVPMRPRRAGAQGRNRTTDTVIFSHVLYQLSYLGVPEGAEDERL